jgi:single-strand DNA-binding protein
MLTLTGNGRLTRDVQPRTTRSGKTVATISIASNRRDRNAEPVYVDLIVWEAQAEAAATHLRKGQMISFAGRFVPREYATSADDRRIALELHEVALEYGPKPRAAEPATQPIPEGASDQANDVEDIPF